MRRMLTNKNVVDIVNQGIASGEIEVEGGLPGYTADNEGQILKVVTDAETGDPALSWENGSLPEIQTGDAGKVLIVNADEDGAEWAEASGGAFKQIGTANIYGAGINLLTTAISGTASSSGGLIVDDWNSANTGGYTLTNVSGGFDQSIFIGSLRYKYLPAMISSIFLGDGCSTTAPNYMNYSIFAGAGDSATQRLNNVTNSILLYGNAQVGSSGTKKNNYDHSIILGGYGAATSSTDLPINYSIVNGGTAVNGQLNTGGVIGCLLMGSSDNQYKNTVNRNSAWSLKGITMLGIGNYADNVYDDASYGLTMVGRWGVTSDAQKDRFVVGTGTSNTARANCFVAGNDSTYGDYIKVGDTMLTEAQLQSLLATLQ